MCVNALGAGKTKIAPKVMPPILLFMTIMLEVAGDGMMVEVGPSHQYSVTCCCSVTDGSRVAV